MADPEASTNPRGATPPGARGDRSDDLSAGIAELAEALFAAGDVKAILQRVVALAAESVDGCDYAGVFVAENDRVSDLR